jgi:hypothetical protein
MNKRGLKLSCVTLSLKKFVKYFNGFQAVTLLCAQGLSQKIKFKNPGIGFLCFTKFSNQAGDEEIFSFTAETL